MNAPEAECIGKGKVRQSFQFGVKVGQAVTRRHGLMVGARSFPDNPYDGHTLAAQIEQTNTLVQDLGIKPTTATVDLGYRDLDKELAPAEVTTWQVQSTNRSRRSRSPDTVRHDESEGGERDGAS